MRTGAQRKAERGYYKHANKFFHISCTSKSRIPHMQWHIQPLIL
nr:MAG TPA: hypothetical protein [Caudoviricetes sp.]